MSDLVLKSGVLGNIINYCDEGACRRHGLKKIMTREKHQWEENLGGWVFCCHYVVLECGHRQIYRHTGVIIDFQECQQCKNL